ncbi:MAG: hypothetical protein LBJ20_03710 [Candidatus Methanoplasma sp.]|jgi:hypothetical protein|nr:hypothetical protein [Candidatus Methanoplasma sp.]
MKSREQRDRSRRARNQLRDDQGRFASELRSGPSGAPVVEYPTKAVRYRDRTYHIPVDKKTNRVPQAAIAARFIATEEGTGRNQRRNVIIDASVDADIILPKDISPEELVPWWANPNMLDVEGIDTKDADLFEVYDLRKKGSQDVQRKIAVAGATSEQQQNIRRIIEDSFTVREQKEIAKEGLVITITDEMPAGVLGSTLGKRGGMAYNIRVRPDVIDDGETILHELVHQSRLVDPKRDDVLLKTRSISRDEILVPCDQMALEEAATVAETAARKQNYKPPKTDTYYGFMGRWRKTKNPADMIREDREIMAGSADEGSSGLRGQKAIKSLIKNFDKTNIKGLSGSHFDSTLPDVTAEETLKALRKR